MWSITCEFVFEGCNGDSDTLDDAERTFDVKVVDLWASFCEDDVIFVLTFKAVCDHKVLDAWFFCPALEG